MIEPEVIMVTLKLIDRLVELINKVADSAEPTPEQMAELKDRIKQSNYRLQKSIAALEAGEKLG